jgi:hypothetical protein
MRLHLNHKRLASILVMGGLLVASAASAATVRATANHQASFSQPHIVVLWKDMGDAHTDGLPKECNNPVFPLMCVRIGRPGLMGIEVTCGSSPSQPCPGTWTWSTSIVNANNKTAKGLLASFSPNPGNPIEETVTKTHQKDGNYTQNIMACPTSGSCATAVYPIVVWGR